ncbi:hypothetical protein [Methyloversatilis sp.]|uniref:hypothetical protein n=1 Tax=Methyloversatilis sp. TaxID=2569862 RepID=UPI0035B1A8C4
MEAGNDAALSRDGKRNAMHIRCDVVGHARPYAVCAHLCEKRKQGELDAIYSECSTAIKRGSCPALAMIAEEKEKGIAIYFKERVKGIAVKLRDAVSNLGSKESPKSTDYNKSAMSEEFSQVDFTRVFEGNTSIEEPIPGESLIEMAKRLAAKRKEHA